MARKKFSVGKFILILTVAGCVGIAGAWVWFMQASSPASPDETKQAFVIKKGEAVDTIAQNLYQKKLIRSVPVFKIIVLKNDIATKIQAGSFTLRPSMSTEEIVRALTSGRKDIWVTIVEGLRREEIADSIEQAFSENDATFDREGFLEATKGKEGYLFPDTYLFPIESDPKVVASILENTLKQKITPEMKAVYESQGKTLNQVLTMASLIEREAKSREARKMVSGILWKRIENLWSLQVDATLQYAKGYNAVQKTWWNPPLGVDKEVDSPYNTYQNQGLPPAPICSPSIDSIMAAIYPTPSEYWFYITDNQGVMRYAETLDQHNQNVEQYLR